MATTDGMYYEFHVPLGLYDAIRNLLDQQRKSPNTPNVVTPNPNREWFSQPRPAVRGELTRPTLFYATGTSYLLDVFGQGVIRLGAGNYLAVPGVDGRVYYWDRAPVNDPFPDMVDPTLWDVQRVTYSSAAFPMGDSISEGVRKTVAAISNTPGKFALGGYGIGAAVMSRVYDEIRYGTLKSRKSDLLGGVTFGSPTRQAGHLWPGATDPRSWDDPSNANGPSHGAFPASYRMTNAEELWWDFANANDPIAAVGDSIAGADFVALIGLLTQTFGGRDLSAFIVSNLTNLPWDDLAGVLAAINQIINLIGSGGGGHLTYATEPPPGGGSLTSYQIALNRFNGIGKQYQTDYTFANTTEVVQINFKQPMPVSDLSFQAIQVPCRVEAWYKDRLENWRTVLDENRNPVLLNMATAPKENWFNFHAYLSPIVAKALQLRITRVPTEEIGNRPYCVGLRNVLVRRNIYNRADGAHATVVYEDAIGNVVSSYIRDWDAPKAIDSNPTTFWRSAPMPDPDAVVCLYLDLRGADGSAQLVDTLYLDPVYTGNILNLYYSNDDSAGTLQLSPISLAPTTDTNTQWRAGRGLWDISTGVQSSLFQAPFKVGPLASKDCWIGVEWVPDFAAASPPDANPVLFAVTPDSAQPGQYWPKLSYDVTAKSVKLEMSNGTTTQTYSAVLTTDPVQGEALKIIAGWSYLSDGSKSILISVYSGANEIGRHASNPANFPALVTLDGLVGFSHLRGTLRAHVVKLENWTKSQASFMANPVAFVDPDTVMPDAEGKVGSGSLDDAILSCDWTVQRYPTGGSHDSAHAQRKWTPIWRDYVTLRGRIYLPGQVSMKYLKLEFTKLTPEPYPVYDSGIQVSYQVYPTSVESTVTSINTSTSTVTSVTHHAGAIEQVANAIAGAVGAVGNAANSLLGNIGHMLGGVAHVNWLDPTSVQAAINSTSGTVAQPVLAAIGNSSPTGAVRNSMAAALSGGTSTNPTAGMAREEMTSSLIQRRPLMDTGVLAAQAVNVLANTDPKQGLTETISTQVLSTVTRNFFPTLTAPQSAITPAQGSDFWLFPGGLLKLPAPIMNGLTGLTKVVCGYNTVSTSTIASTTATTKRVRFDTVEIHRYQTRTITRDAALAYFAGVREVAAYSTAYIPDEDPTSFDFSMYDPSQWRFSGNYRKLDNGSVAVQDDPYADADIDTELNLDAWTKIGSWTWESAQDNYTDFLAQRGDTPLRIGRVGAAKIEADGNYLSMTARKPVSVKSGDTLAISGWVKHINAVSNGNQNLANNGTFEDATLSSGSATRTTTVSRTGSYSAQLTANGSGNQICWVTSTTSTNLKISCVAGDTYYLEGWVYGKSTNSQSTGGVGGIGLYLTSYTSSGATISTLAAATLTAGTALNSKWTKLSGYVTIPANADTFSASFRINTTTSNGEVYYFDDAVVRKSGQIIMDVLTYDSSGNLVGPADLTPLASTTPAAGYTPPSYLDAGTASIVALREPSGTTEGVTFTELVGTYTVPSSGVASIALRFRVTSGVTAGTVWVTGPQMRQTGANKAYLYNRFVTASTFSKVVCDFRDSGLVRSNKMWARSDPLNTNVDKYALSWYTSPSTMPPGMWGDAFADWSDANVKWGSARPLVAITIKSDQVYKGNRVLHFTRAAGAGSAGIRVMQMTNYVPGCMARIGCVFYKPVANNNTITLRLRRISDGVYIHEEDLVDPPSGTWHTYTTPMFDIPDSLDQRYYVEFSATGSSEDDIYLSDLYSEIALVRYSMQLGGAGAPLIDVTELAHSTSDAIVTATDPVKEVSVNVTLLGNSLPLSTNAIATGATITPVYLK